jgi:hypothetical protein
MPTILSPKRWLSLVIVTAVYIPPQADTTTALKELHWTLNHHPEAAFIVSGDFNKANLRTRLPKFYLHIDSRTHAGNTLDHCYFNFRGAYKALPRHPFDKSDPNSILLLLSYKQKLKQDVPVTMLA